LAVLAANLRPLHAAVPAAVPIPASFVTGGRWINRHLPAGQRIAAISSGYLAHEADAHTVVNLDGLANDSEYFHEYMEKPRLAEYLRNRKIDYFADVGSIADLAAGIGSVNGGVPLSELRLVRWWLHDEHQAFCVWKLWPRVGERFPTDAVSRIQFDAAVLHRYRIADPGELGTLATSERVVTSIVPPTGELRHVVMPAETADRLPLARDTVLPELRFDTGVGAGLRLLGVDLPRTPIRPGDRLVITRYWELGADAANAPEGEVVMRLGERELHAARLCHGTLRASDWRAGRVVVETYAVTLPADVASGPHAVFLEVRLPGGTLLPHESGSQPLFIDNLEVY
jgi:hypothetical protein